MRREYNDNVIALVMQDYRHTMSDHFTVLVWDRRKGTGPAPHREPRAVVTRVRPGQSLPHAIASSVRRFRRLNNTSATR